MNSQIQFQSKEELAYIKLREAIIKCRIKPGGKVIIDRLSEDFGVSQIPMRAAIRRLQTEGLVITHPHSSPIAAPLSPQKIDEVFLLLESLELSAFRVAAEKAGESDFQDLEKVIHDMQTDAESGNKFNWMLQNIAFHRRIAEISGMEMLISFTERVLSEWERICHYYFEDVTSQRLGKAHDEHCRIVRCLRDGDVEKLNEIAVRHNRAANLAYQKLLQDHFK